jgi:aminoacylase
MTIPPSVQRFQEYLRIKTVHPQPAYAECSEWLLNQAKDIGIPAYIFEAKPGKPFVIMTVAGKQANLASLMLCKPFPCFSSQCTLPGLFLNDHDCF